MRFTPTEIPEVVLVEPRVFGDHRGFFLETWQKEKFAQGGIDATFVQDNHSGSGRGVLRGVHYQLTQPQGKLVRVTVGEVFDVAVDLRRSSPTFGRWVGRTLSADNRRMLWVPEGFGHAFLVRSEFAEFQYKCTRLYAPEDERTLRWDDPSVGIDWPLEGDPVLSDRDRAGASLEEADTYA